MVYFGKCRVVIRITPVTRGGGGGQHFSQSVLEIKLNGFSVDIVCFAVNFKAMSYPFSYLNAYNILKE